MNICLKNNYCQKWFRAETILANTHENPDPGPVENVRKATHLRELHF